MVDVKKLADSLHPLERKVLPLCRSHSTPESICSSGGLSETEVLRALQWLQNKALVSVHISEAEMVLLGGNGESYRKKSLPERRFLDALLGGPVAIGKLPQKAGLTHEETNICLGVLRSMSAIMLSKQKDLVVSLTEKGTELQSHELPAEGFLKGDFPRPVDSLSAGEKASLKDLRKRKDIVGVEKVKTRTVTMTPLGETLLQLGVSSGKFIDALTPELLRSGDWKSKSFRRFDITAPVPRISGGRRHFVEEATSYIRKIWLEMGFVEMSGGMVQSAFWDLDTLFVPQDHPARDMQDTFYIKGVSKVPVDIMKRVKAVHENGGKTGSKGWGGSYSEDVAKKVLLRTHTTVLSARTIAALKDTDLPAKFFTVNRIFRNETLDWKHLFEFHQVEGIVVDPKANLRQLIGYLREFYRKMGYPQVRVRPAFFPYTEPSLQVEVFHPVRKEWLELGGAGILRPEVVIPLLGKDIPVLAWGQGLERIILDYYKFQDIRDVYRNDLEQLRTAKAWVM